MNAGQPVIEVSELVAGIPSVGETVSQYIENGRYEIDRQGCWHQAVGLLIAVNPAGQGDDQKVIRVVCRLSLQKAVIRHIVWHQYHTARSSICTIRYNCQDIRLHESQLFQPGTCNPARNAGHGILTPTV
jgi:hypothetical protein